MKRLWFILILGLLISCSYENNKVVRIQVNPKYFSYNIDFAPSFIPPCRISIIKNDKTGKIFFKVYKYSESSVTLSAAFEDSTVLNESDFKYFFHTLDTIQLMKMKSDGSVGVDGISISNTYYQDTIKNTFDFWSPNKGRKEHKIIEAVIGLGRQKFTSLKHQEYFESLEQYFDFGLPCKKISDNPYEIRIYGNLTSSEEQELNKFINDLPSDKPILIDMTNFQSMGTMFYPLFRNLITRNANIIWVIKKGNSEDLIEIGVASRNIALDIEIARQWVKKIVP